MNKIKQYIFYVLIPIVLITIIFILWPKESITKTPPIPKIEQSVNILDEDKKSTLEYNWLMENEEDLKDGKLKMSDCPYTDKTIYKLKTSMDSLTSFVYGTQPEIERQKCIEYNKFIEIRKDLLTLNKPTTCK
jgi:hypothetical protein